MKILILCPYNTMQSVQILDGGTKLRLRTNITTSKKANFIET